MILSREEDYSLARVIEKETNFSISFFDILHFLLAKRKVVILITRYFLLIQTAKKYSVRVKKPEELIH